MVVARRIRKQVKERDRREQEAELRPDYQPFNLIDGEKVERFWEECDPDWAVA